MATNSKVGAGLVVGIDAANLRRGGGVTHLVELLSAFDPREIGVAQFIVWGGAETLANLPDHPWIQKINPKALDQGLLRRTLWQRFSLSRVARDARSDILFVPGGNFSGSFRPFVTMSRNMLPFEWRELKRFGMSLTTLKLAILRLSQSRSLRRANGVIFLTDYAKKTVQDVTGALGAKTSTIPHGLNPRFSSKPKPQKPIEAFSDAHPYRMLYVSIIDQYKHQWHVVEAVHALRETGLPVQLELVGPAYPPALKRLEATLARLDPERQWVRYHGAVQYETLHKIYKQAQLGIFASSCENMPNILLETMAAGLPIACSNRGPMPEVLGNAGVYFDPESPSDIKTTLLQLISSPDVRERCASASFEKSKSYSWRLCAERTCAFLIEVEKSVTR